MLSWYDEDPVQFWESEKYVKPFRPRTYWFAYIILGFLLSNCTTPQPQREFSGEDIFRTTQPSRLFFANTRSHRYFRKRPQGTDLDVYRLRKFQITSKRPMLVPIIVDAYLKDEAYLFIEANGFPGLSDPITFRIESDSIIDTFSLDLPSRLAQLEFATDLYEGILNGNKLGVSVRDTGFMEIYGKRSERAAFRAVINDYYRLTERI